MTGGVAVHTVPIAKGRSDTRRKSAVWIVVLSAVQIICAGFFVSEFLTEVLGLRRWAIPFELREILQILATIGLVLGVASSILLLKQTRRQLAKTQAQLEAASGAFFDVVNDFFDDWGLSPSERDVALFAVRGCSNSEIAALRGKSEATVKSQMNAVFRKAGVTGRSQLLSLLIDTLITHRA